MSEEEAKSLITDEHRAEIGIKGDPVEVIVRAEDAHRMRDLLNDHDPRWADGTDVGAPYTIASFGARPNRRMPQVLPAGLLTNQEWKFSRPFKLGEKLSAVSQTVDIRERMGGRYGHSVLVTTVTDYFDTNGEHVCASLATFTQFDPKREQKKSGGDE